MGAYICGVLLFAIYKIVASACICAALAAFYTTGMTVVLMGFVLEPLDCLLQCYESVNTDVKKHSNCCEEGGAFYSALQYTSIA